MEDKLIIKNECLLKYDDSGISHMKIPIWENKKIRKEFEDIINKNGIDTMLELPDFVITKFILDMLDSLEYVARNAHTHSHHLIKPI